MKKLLIILGLLLCIMPNVLFAEGNIYSSLDQISVLAEKAAKSVVSLEVSITGKKQVKLLYRDRQKGSERLRVKPKSVDFEEKVGDGSGFIISRSGHIVTNAHVVSPKVRGKEVSPSKIEVSLYNGDKYEAEVIGKDRDSDIAVIKINASGLIPIKWGDSDRVMPGHFALTIGSALGAEHTVGFGIISAVSRKKPNVSKEALLGDLDYIQTYAQINPGNSGGPLIDLDGNIIGITSFIQVAPHSPGFAIPSNYAKRVVTALIQDGSVYRPSIGVVIASPASSTQDIFSLFARELDYSQPEKEEGGVIVHHVLPDGPADFAGLKEGDLVLEINNKETESPVEFIRTIRTRPIGSQFTLKIKRYDNKGEKILNIIVKSVSTKSG